MHPRKICRWHIWKRECHPEGPGRAQEMGPWESHAVLQYWQQGAAPGSETTQTGNKQTKSSLAQKDLGMLVDERLDIFWQCALAANVQLIQSNLGFHPKQHGQQGMGKDSVHSSHLVKPHLHPAVGHPAQKGQQPVEACPEEHYCRNKGDFPLWGKTGKNLFKIF